mmetsp:Transcript_101802/g.296827  ORF Transcript_101802/g.296827 Transcript_101802/m.296827 type:complete len:250 (+) Transcript_101802:389-1138(+)
MGSPDCAGHVTLGDLLGRMASPGSVAQHAVCLRHHPAAAVVAHEAMGVHAHADVVHDLVDHGEDLCIAEAVQAAWAVVGDTNCPQLPGLVVLLHGPPLLPDHLTAACEVSARAEQEGLSWGEVEDHKVDVRDVQQLQVGVQVLLGVLIAVEGVPHGGVHQATWHLRLKEDTLAGDRGDGAAHAILVVVVECSVHHREASGQGRLHSVVRLGGVVLPGPLGDHGHLHAIAKRDGGWVCREGRGTKAQQKG